jgi:hypothetical protein
VASYQEFGEQLILMRKAFRQVVLELLEQLKGCELLNLSGEAGVHLAEDKSSFDVPICSIK